MLISVVIPHLNQEEYLEKGLAALHAQDAISSDLEFIVVDNGSKRLPFEICSRWPDVRLVSESTPGPGPARNRGVSIAKGNILAFIDADCRADRGWLAAIERAFGDPQTHIIGGDVQCPYDDSANIRFHEPYEAIYSYRNDEHIAEGFSGTGNLAVRRDVIVTVGTFAGIAVAEDRDWGLRAGHAGYRIQYRPDMIVYHPPRPNFSDLTLKWDRHISHDYAEARGTTGIAKWLVKAFALAVSPVAEIPRIAGSKRVSGIKERLLAFLCLARIRLHRTRRMLEILLPGNAAAHADKWNRR